MEKQRERNRFVIDKNQPYEYNIAMIILGKLSNEGIIDIFDMAEHLIKLKKFLSMNTMSLSTCIPYCQIIIDNHIL